jgi:hypothetical protein
MEAYSSAYFSDTGQNMAKCPLKLNLSGPLEISNHIMTQAYCPKFHDLLPLHNSVAYDLCISDRITVST